MQVGKRGRGLSARDSIHSTTLGSVRVANRLVRQEMSRTPSCTMQYFYLTGQLARTNCADEARAMYRKTLLRRAVLIEGLFFQTLFSRIFLYFHISNSKDFLSKFRHFFSPNYLYFLIFHFFSKNWNAKPFRKMFPVFLVFPVFLGRKKRKNWEKVAW